LDGVLWTLDCMVWQKLSWTERRCPFHWELFISPGDSGRGVVFSKFPDSNITEMMWGHWRREHEGELHGFQFKANCRPWTIDLDHEAIAQESSAPHC
jgi:hypothetical protein